ncbi:toprim domain-containing protein [Clostridium algidicarnis]|uniref:toprim domain-containing protein n=1 Tax=Clostridium algidicarnis TaxID=37659 RepID=UPI001C0E8202|nr:toprim domain-containing protein [Clostridium algidicarnis]MBU3250074.1 toprim domain-containing protein [Clostridium algidicarnis]
MSRQTNYFKKRGFSTKIIDKYKLGYNPDGLNYIIKNYPDVLEEKENKFYTSYQFFIPFFDEFGNCNYILPRRDDNIKKPNWVTYKNIKVHNLKGYSAAIFNSRYLKNKDLTDNYIFIVEGWSDALSLEELGYNAIALNSTSNVNLFLKEIKINKKNITKKTFIISADADKSGIIMNSNLSKGFKEENIDSNIFNIIKYKDLNDWLIADREGLSANLKDFLQKNEKHNLISNTFNNSKKICVEKYISQGNDAVEAILNNIKSSKKILITGAMGIGKTHFIRTDLLNYARSIDKKIVMVIPGVAQLENLKENKGLPVVYADVGYYDTDIVAVTPESLLTKVISNLKPQTFILVVDEAHQKVLDYNFRKAFRNISIAEKTAYKIIYMTATPRVLGNEKFDNILEVITNNPIKNKIVIETIDNKNKIDLMDIKLNIIKENLKNHDNIIFFQNNKKSNTDMADILAEGQKVTEKIYKDNYQYSVCLQSNSKDYVEKTFWKWITKTQTIESGKENIETKEGLITANISFVTSVITAGIDLHVPDGNKALLIIDATEKIDVDSIIQLIGRFREGINVVILVKPTSKEKNKYDSFENILKSRMQISTEIAEVYNKNKVEIEYYKSDICVNGIEFNEEKKLYNIDPLAVSSKSYSLWNINLMYNISEFIKLLEKQTAFKIINEIEVCSWEEENYEINSEIKDLKTSRKEDFKKAKEKILELDDKTLLAAITKNYTKLTSEKQKIIKEYYDLQPNSHKDKINLTKKLFIDEKDQATDVVKVFRYFYNNSWEKIQNEIDDRDSKLINMDFRLNGVEPFLDKDLYKIRTQKIQQQAKIRWELQQLEKKQGRLSNKIINSITNEMIKEAYFKNKNVKIYLDIKSPENERIKAFNMVKKTVLKIIKHTYNLTKDGRISSVKY